MKKMNPITILPVITLISLFLSNHTFAGNTLDSADGSPTNAVYVDNDGNVGIGTTSPQSKLHIYSTTLSSEEMLTLDKHTGWSNFSNALQSIKWRDGSNVVGAIGLSYDGTSVNAQFHSMYNSGYKNESDVVMTIKGTGNVGIGTTSPSEKLAVAGNIDMTGINGTRIYMGGVSGGNFGLAFSSIYPNYGIFYLEGSPDRIVLSPDGGGATGSNFVVLGSGNVGIGTTTPDYKLDVLGTIRATEVKVATGWSDFVFEDSYNLPSLDQVESFIEENNHLPDIPSAEEIEENGLSMAEMMAKQMQKIEELTLYVIEQNKKLADLSEENKELKNRIIALEKGN